MNLLLRHSQEIIRGPSGYVRLSSPWCRVEHQEVVVHVLVHLHDSCLVCTPVTIVGG